MRHRVSGLLVLGLLAACNNSNGTSPLSVSTVMRDNHPARMAVPDFTAPVYDQEVHPLSVPVLNAAGEDLGVQVAVSVLPANVATATTNSVQCLATGDATLVFSGGGLSTNTILHCRPVARLRVPDSLTLTVGENPVPVTADALNEAGAAVADVPIRAAPADLNIAVLSNGAARGLRVGATTLRYTVGTRTLAEVPVVVRERIFSGPLLLGDGAQQTRSLTQGKYHIEIQVQPSDGAINVSWVGAACTNQSNTHRYVTDCVVPSTASMTVTNPSGFLGLGDNAHGFTSIFLMPNG